MMLQDYRLLSDEQHAQLEKQTLYAIVHAIQQYSREAKRLFDSAPADSKSEVIVVAEDIVQYAIEVAEVYPLDERFAGFTDYKRVRWLSLPFGVVPQALLVDAKASTETSRANLQRSQLPMDAEFYVGEGVAREDRRIAAGLPPHLDIEVNGGVVPAPTTSVFIHFHYNTIRQPEPSGPFRNLKSIIILCIPHRRFKQFYNPNAGRGFWQKGKESTRRKEALRIRVTLAELAALRPWRVQRLLYAGGQDGYTIPRWQDVDQSGDAGPTEFLFKGR